MVIDNGNGAGTMRRRPFSERIQDPEYRKLLEREEFIESFLEMVEEEMDSREVSEQVLAERLGCTLDRLSRILRRERYMTATMMVDIAFHLGLRIKLTKQKLDGRCWEVGDE